MADPWTIENQVGLSQLLKKGGPQRFSIRRSGAEGQSRTDTGLPPPVFEFVERYRFSSCRAYAHPLPYQYETPFCAWQSLLSRLVPR